MYIAIAGNIGSGKTSLTGILAERTGARAYYEDSDNPYIGDFYEDMNRWSFNLQIYFLGQRIARRRRSPPKRADLIQDRTIYEGAYIFASNLHGLGLMSSRDFDTYMKIFDLATGLIRKPDLLIYLKRASRPSSNRLETRTLRGQHSGGLPRTTEPKVRRVDQQYLPRRSDDD